MDLSEIRKLSVEEGIQLVEAIWDSIALEDEALPITDAQRRELGRRIAEHESDPRGGQDWEEFRDELMREE
jgi:putative addiction module component (TIGR02574 family)